MDFNGRSLQQMQNSIGLSPTVVCAEAGVAMSTLYAVYGNKSHVKQLTVNKVREALQRLSSRNPLREQSTATA